MKAAIRRIIPTRIASRVARWRRRFENFRGGLFCPLCKSNVVRFLPHGIPVREDILCPICRSKACHRLASLWFRDVSRWLRRDGLFVHVAPEVELGRQIRQACRNSGMRYLHGDLRDPENMIDIMNLSFADQTVDVLFACHVLNMVPDDRKAMCEIFRVLKPGGIAIVPVPIHPDVLATIEADAGSRPEERFALFRDDMMFRKYSPEDFLTRLEVTGFRPNAIRPSELDNVDPVRSRLCEEWFQFGVRPKEIGMV